MLSLGSTASYTRAIQFVGQSTALDTVLDLPSNLESNDFMIVMVLNEAGTPSESGWTLGGSGTAGSLNYYWYWKYFETGDTTFTRSDNSRAMLCVAFRNVDPMYPFDATPTSAIGASNAGDPNPPEITTVSPNTLIVALGWLDDDSVAITAPADPAYRLVSNSIGSGSGTVTAGSIAVAIKELTTAGAENPEAFTGSGSDDWAAVTVALRSSAYAQQMVAYSSTGTLIHTFGGYKYHVFTSSTSTFHVVSTGTVDKIEVLCVAGGGGGGEGASGGGGGGGGAGGVEMLAVTPSATNYAISIGAGGAGSTTNAAKGSDGSASSFASTVVATVGGGGGGSAGTAGVRSGNSGGSGGGGGTTDGVGGTSLTPTEGNDGGNAVSGNGGGGGGGAGGNGGNANTTDRGGNGGAGTADYSTWFTHITSAGGATYGENGSIASGGGGGGDVTGGTSPDGGGANGTAGATNATAATANTGGGGGGSETGNGSNGGSGIVIVRYRHVALG